MSLYKGEIWDTETHTQGEGCVEIGVLQPQAKELPEARREPGKDPSSAVLEDAHPTDTLILTSSLQNVRQYISVVLASQLVVLCYNSHRRLIPCV